MPVAKLPFKKQLSYACGMIGWSIMTNLIIVMLPYFYLPPSGSGLVPLLPQYPLPEWSINLIYPPHRHPSTIVRTYLDFCQGYLPKIVQACET